MAWRAIGISVTSVLLWGWPGGTPSAQAEDSRFAMTYSRSQYVHWIDLYDAVGDRIDPSDPGAAPYSPVHTCGKCHDYKAIAHGYHFNAMSKLTENGRAGEPWIWTDTRTGTQIPLSYRGWPGTYQPGSLGISAWDLVLKFGRQMPGGGPGSPADAANDEAAEVSARDVEQTGQPAEPETASVADNGRWALSGELAIDCMMCHSRDRAYSPEKWWDQVSKQNFAWAPAAALGIADVDGDVSKLDDEAPASAPEGEGASAGKSPQARTDLPITTYRIARMDTDNKVFFDVTRTPPNDACYFCHTSRIVGTGASPDWTHDEDVHLRAGMACADCHRHGIEHDMVRGFEGETHPSGMEVATLSCRGCHLGEQSDAQTLPGGRLGAPKPLHKGLPPVHLERLSCTVCHSGPPPSAEALQVQTAMAHALGLPTHDLTASSEPQMVAPVLLRTDEVLYPHRMVWPAFWGELKGDAVTPLNPEAVNDTLRRVLRVKRNATFTETLGEVKLSDEDKVAVLGAERAGVEPTQWTDEEKAKMNALEKTKSTEAFREKLVPALVELKKAIKTAGAEPVYVAGGRAYRLAVDGKVEVFANPAADPYAWKLAHDVRPARWSSGAGGCLDCHQPDREFFDGRVTALGPALDTDPPSEKMAELAGYDRVQIDAWNRSFQGRAAFKWFGFASAGIVTVILLSFLMLGVNGVFGLFRRS